MPWYYGSYFSRDCGSVPADQSENAERGTRAMKRKLSPAMIQKQEQMRQQTVEKGEGLHGRLFLLLNKMDR